MNTGAELALEALGQFAPLLADNDVVELSANPDGRIFCDRFGTGWEHVGDMSEGQRMQFVRVCASATGDMINENTPIYSGRVPGTAHRVEVLHAPVVSGTAFSIRRHRELTLGFDDFDITADIKKRLTCALHERRNIVIAAGTKAGKTTFANVCMAEIERAAPQTRAIILEDTDELNSPFANTVKLRACQQAGFDMLLASTLRLAPTRIFLGEVRTGAQALSLLKVWNTGHPGGLTTIHADSVFEISARFAELIGEVSQSDQSALIKRAIDGILFLERGLSAPKVTEFVLRDRGTSS